jgi:hypothetical protein
MFSAAASSPPRLSSAIQIYRDTILLYTTYYVRRVSPRPSGLLHIIWVRVTARYLCYAPMKHKLAEGNAVAAAADPRVCSSICYDIIYYTRVGGTYTYNIISYSLTRHTVSFANSSWYVFQLYVGCIARMCAGVYRQGGI